MLDAPSSSILLAWPDRTRSRAVATFVRASTQEHMPLAPVCAAMIVEVDRQRFADLDGQRHQLVIVALAGDPHRGGAPVHIIEQQPGGLSRAQPQPGQQHQQCPGPGPSCPPRSSRPGPPRTGLSTP